MRKRGVFFSVLIALILIPGISAAENISNFDPTLGYTYLLQNNQNGNFGNDLQTTAFATMALRNIGASEYADLGVAYIKSQEDESKSCWPKGGCKPKETAFAMWVLREYGEDVSESEEWLTNAMTAALKGNWFLEVLTSNNGSCKISYDKGQDNIQKDVAVNQGTFPNCNGPFPNTFFELNTCLESNLINNNPGIELDVNCNDLGPSTTISVIYNEGNNYYIIDEAATSHYVTTIENGCFGTTPKGNCNFDASLFTNWHLTNIGSDIKILLFLKSKFDKLKATDNALIYLSTPGTNKENYITNLKEIQRNDGSFDKQVFDTAMAILALKTSASASQEAQKAKAWLEEKQKPDGSWDNNVLKTAAVLFAAFSDTTLNLPPLSNLPPGSQPSAGFCGDGICDGSLAENSFNCNLDCKQESSDVCVTNGVCETHLGENTANCGTDCTCGDNICDTSESEETCSDDCGSASETPGEEATCGDGFVEGAEQCDIDPSTNSGDDSVCPGACISAGEVNECMCKEKSSGFPWWIPFIIVLVLGAVIMLYVKMHGSNKKDTKKPGAFDLGSWAGSTGKKEIKSYYPLEKSNPKKEQKSNIDKELDKSIEEAKRLLKKL